MRPRPDFERPVTLASQQAAARRLAWWSLLVMVAVTAGVYSVTGASQAMKTAWAEDLLSLVVPAAFLLSVHFRGRTPSPTFPYGYHRCSSVAFLVGAVCLTVFGLWLLGDSVAVLVSGERPTIGTVEVLGQAFWAGWLMVGVLVASAVPPMVLGHRKAVLARALQDKALKTDAAMNKADWQTALAGAIGIVGVGFGLWWADAVAGAVIAGSVLRDGCENLREVTVNLLDGAPLTLEGRRSPVPEQVRVAVAALPWVADVQVRLREEGDLLAGELFVTARDGGAPASRLQEARKAAASVDWRIRDLVVQITTPD